jgi:vacuolar-type H+-ATPase subunit H
VNEERLRQILELEKRANAIHQDAAREAEQLPGQARKQGRALIEQARAEAQAQARQMIDQAQETEECGHILNEANQEADRMRALAMAHFDRAVSFVLNRLTGRE